MAALSLTSPVLGGTTESLATAAVGGDTFPLPRPITIQAKNPTGGSITLTLVGARACNQGSLHDGTVAIGAGATKFIRVDDVDRFRNPTTGLLSMTYSAVGLTLAAY